MSHATITGESVDWIPGVVCGIINEAQTPRPPVEAPVPPVAGETSATGWGASGGADRVAWGGHTRLD